MDSGMDDSDRLREEPADVSALPKSLWELARWLPLWGGDRACDSDRGGAGEEEETEALDGGGGTGDRGRLCGSPRPPPPAAVSRASGSAGKRGRSRGGAIGDVRWLGAAPVLAASAGSAEATATAVAGTTVPAWQQQQQGSDVVTGGGLGGTEGARGAGTDTVGGAGEGRGHGNGGGGGAVDDGRGAHGDGHGDLGDVDSDGGDGREGSAAGLTCNSCGCSAFESILQQRQHFKSDWHRLNVKRKSRGRRAMSEEEFAAWLGSSSRLRDGSSSAAKAKPKRSSSAAATAAADSPQAQFSDDGNAVDDDDDDDLSSISGSEDEDEGEEGDLPSVVEEGDGGSAANLLQTGRSGRGRRGGAVTGGGRPPKEWYGVLDHRLAFGVWRVALGAGIAQKGKTGTEESKQQQQQQQQHRMAGLHSLLAKLRDDSSLGCDAQCAAQTALKPSPAAGAAVAAAGAAGAQAASAAAITSAAGCVWVVVLASGGHFAAAVFDMRRQAHVLAHKTFHRYVVRAKAGGRQSTRDATGRAPHSAGASLRRYNEAALEKDIQDLLLSWSPYLNSAHSIFIHAPAASQKALFGAGGGSSSSGGGGGSSGGSGSATSGGGLSKGDVRICGVPFAVRRPTFKEACRVVQVLGEVSWATLQEAAEKPTASPAAAAAAAAGTGEARAGEGRLDAAVTIRGRGDGGGNGGGRGNVYEAEASDEEEDGSTGVVNGAGEVAEERQPSELHTAAAAGNVARVLALLQAGADPTARDGHRRTPYAVAKDRDTRNAFRRHMGEHPDQWDWHAAGVPSALTDNMESKQAEKEQRWKEKEKERKKAAKKRAKQKQQQQKQEEQKQQEQEKKAATPPLTPEQALAREREMRAAAAERRFAAMKIAETNSNPRPSGSGPEANSASGSAAARVNEGGRKCDSCHAPLGNRTPFYRLTFAYCSTTCVRAHKIVLESE